MSSSPAKMNPFPGLRPFTQEEDYLFFGREEQTLELLQRLGSNRFVAVVGTSGSGKSSLVRCGLLSELLGGRMMGAGSSWEIAVTHPGGNPLALLTDSLLEADLYDREEEHARENLLATLSRSHFGLVEAVKQSSLFQSEREGEAPAEPSSTPLTRSDSAGASPSRGASSRAEPSNQTNFLLVVDQFEEIFRFQDAGQRQQEVANEFVSLLLEAVAQKEVPIYVVLTMRSDFIGECGQFEGLAEMVNKGEFLIPRLTREQYKRVIEGPIKVAGGQIAPRLLQRLLNDLGQQADQLPCLQHALMRTWDVWAQKKGSGLIERNGPEGAAHQLDLTPFSALDLDDYQRVGRMAEALSLHADEIYESLSSDRQRELCKGLFQALTVEESNNRGIRRPQRLGRLCQILEVPAEELFPIIDAYRHSGVTFLMPSPDVELTESTIIDISHESLMRVWTRLRQWVEEESQAAGIYHRLSESADLREQGKAGLYRDPELGIALAWQEAKRPNAAWAERYRPGFAQAMAFLEASQQAGVAEDQAREAARQRELEQAQRLAEAEGQRARDQTRAAVRLRWMVRGLGLVAMLAIMATVFAWLARQEARRNADTALQAQQDTERALKEAEASETLAKVNEAEAERQKAAALRAEQRSREFLYATDIELAARMVNDKTANAAQLSDRLADFDPTMNKSLVATDDMRGFEWYYLKKLVDSRSSVFAGFNKPVIAVALASEGVLITLDEEAQVRRFDAGTKQERGAPTDLKKGRNIVAKTLSPDGQRVAIASGNEVQIFDSVSGEQIGRSIPTQVRGGLIFSPDSRMLITMDTGLGWWDAATCKPIAVQDFQLTIFSNPLQPLSTSADGLTLAVGGQGTYQSAFSVFKLDPKTREITRLLDNIGAQGTKRAMALSPDGGTVAISLYFQGGIYVYETATGKLVQTQPSAHSSAISAIAFAEDSTQMVTASLDGTIKLWNDYRKLDPDEANTFIGHAEEVNLLSILPGDKQLLSASSDKTVRVWNLGQSKTELHKKLAGAMGSPRASFSADGTLIATPGGFTGSTAGNRLRIWDATTGQPAMEFPEGSRTDLSADSVAFSPDGRLLAAGFGGIQDVSYIELWDIDRRERIGVLPGSTAIPGFTTDENSGTIPGLAFSPDGKHLVAAFGSMNLMSRGDTGNVPLLIYDVATRQVVRRLEGHRNFCMAVAFSRDGSRMASASQDGTARIWDTATWRELQVLDNPDTASQAGQRRVYDVAFSPNGTLLAMASAEGNVILFDVASGEVLRKLRGHSNEVRGVAFAPDGLTLASGSIDGTIRFWNTATWRELLRLEPEKGFTPYSISFSPNGDRLLASAYGTAGTLLWSIPRDGSASGTTTEPLAKILDSNLDFRHRIRLLSDDLQLHEPLAILAQREPNRAEVQAALAATRAHWHAERSEWGQAVEQFDLLWEGEAPAEPAQRELRPPNSLRPPDARANVATQYLRTPGLLRLATALFYEGRSADAASLLIGGEARRAEDGNGTRSDSFGFEYDPSSTPVKLTKIFRGSPAWNGGLRVGDALLKINDIEVKSENRAKYQDVMQNPIEGKLSITFQHSGMDQPETAEITKARYIQDDLTVELIENLLAAVDKKLAESANDPGLLELRAELAGQSSNFEQQVADYTAAVQSLSERPAAESAADLARLHRRRGNAFLGMKQWQQAKDDYAKGIAGEIRDEILLTNQALAQAECLVSSEWTLLQPTLMSAANGTTLSLEPDGSILAGGINPPADTYTIIAPLSLKRISAVRLETLPHPSLPRGGSGRDSNGYFRLNKFTVAVALAEHAVADNAQDLEISGAVSSYDGTLGVLESIAGAINNGSGAWGVWPQVAQPHQAIFKLESQPEIPDGSVLIIRIAMNSGSATLGHFRLSVSDREEPLNAQREDLVAAFERSKITNGWEKLAYAYRRRNELTALDQLAEDRPRSVAFIGDLFIQGEDKNWQRAVEIYSKGIPPETNDSELLSKRAKAYEALKEWGAAAADWQRAAPFIPDGTKTLIEFAQRLANSDQPDLAMVVRDRALSLLETTLASDPDNVVAVDQMAGLLLEPDQRLVFGLASVDQDAMTRITALRVETSSDALPPAGDVPPFSEYQILSTKLPEQGFRGRFVRLDLPGENGQFPRFTKDGEAKHINLSELQILQGDLNTALNKKATASSGEGNYAPQRAVDGNTDGNDVTHSYAHTWDTENPWWEVDLGSEQAFDRMIVWNRSDVDLYPRMNHFRVQILDANRELVYERVIDQAPAPSTEIRRNVNWSPVAATDARESSVRQLNFGLEKDSVPPARIRVSGTAEVLRETTAERANDTGWVEIPNALNTQSTGSLALDAQTLAKITQQSRLAQATKIADAPTRLAAAYELGRKPAAAAEQFRRTLDRARTDAAREAVLKELSNYPEALAALIQQRPGDPQLQIALARRHMAMGQKELEAKEPNAALIELQKARDLFERLLEQHPAHKWTVLQPSEMKSKAGATLTLKDDSSVFVNGNLQVKDTFKLDVSGFPAGVTAVRIEALRDSSLPNGGPGTHGSGNFVLSEFQVLAGKKADIQSATPVPLEAAFASVEERPAKNSLSPGESGWSILRGGSSETAVFKLLEPRSLSEKDVMRIVLDFYHDPAGGGTALLGRFRLSVTTEPIDNDSLRLTNLKDSELAALDVGIGKALAQLDKADQAAAAFARALNRVEDENEQKSLIELFQDEEAVLTLLAEQRPHDLALQLALAQRLAESGQAALASNRQDEALSQLTKARELFASLAAKHPESEWIVLTPTEMSTASGAAMKLQQDGSVFVQQPPQNDSYSLVFETDLVGIKGLRLETLSDPRASESRPGFGGGNIVLSEFTLQAVSSNSSDPPRSIKLQNAIADFSQAGFDATRCADGTDDTSWAVYPEVNKDHMVVVDLGEELGNGQTTRLNVRLSHRHSGDKYPLGRFRVSATTTANASEVVRFHQGLKASGLSNLDASFATAYAEEDRLDEAAGSYARVLDLAVDLQSRAKTISEADGHPGLLAKLAPLKADDAAFLDSLARHYQQKGELLLARDAAMKARVLYEEKLGAQPHDSKLASALADLLSWASPQEWTVLRLTEVQSAGGATLTLLEDDSILASGNNASGDTYTLAADGDRKIAAVRLEVLPDDSLPNKGPGRHPTGNFQLKAIRMYRSNRDTKEDRIPIPLQSAVASFAYSANDADVRGTIDDSLNKVWHVWGRFGEPHVAQYLLQQPVELQDGEKMTIVLEHIGYAEGINLGRFRISTSSDPGLFDAEKRRNELQQYASAWAKLAAAYQTVGEPEKALATLSGAVKLAASDSAKVALSQEAAISEELLDQLLQQSPDDKWLRLGQAKYQGKKLLAEGRTAAAVQVLTAAIETAPSDLDLLNQRAGAHMKLAQWQAAAADYARILELETDNGRRREAESLLAEVQLRLGNFQAGADGYFERMLLIPNDEWALRDAATAQLLASTSGISQAVARRFLEKSGSSKNKDLVQWLVRIHVARPGLITKENSPKLLEAAKVAESPWTEPMTAAIHYRLGDLKQAEPLLTEANGDSQFQALAAMLLYDQGKTDEARALLSNSSAWLDRERSQDTGSVIPVQQVWQTWTVNLIAQREAARKLMGLRITELDELLALEPGRSSELLERARLLTNVGLVEEALRDLQSLVTQNVTSPESSALHGRILAGLGRDEEALPYLNRAIDSGSLDSDVYAARGTLLLKQQQSDTARVDLEKSIELKPNALAASSLADLLLSESDHWSVLEPAEMKSESGATLTRLADDSILVSGLDPGKDSYTMTAAAGLPNITSIRLEAIPDPSLPSSGPGRAPNFVLTDVQVSSSAQAVQFAQAIATYEQRTAEAFYPAESAIDQDPLTGWAVYPRVGQSHSAFFQLKNPLILDEHAPLVIVLHFESVHLKHVLGRFRLSVSDDPEVFDREEKRLAALKLTDPWARLAAAYLIQNDQQSFDQLIRAIPSVEASFAELYVLEKNWQRAIAAYSKLIREETTDASLFVKRGEAYFASKQLDLARADWRRAVELRPELAQTQFDRLRLASRWSEAAEFGLLLIEKKPEDTMLWVQVPPVAVLAEHEAIYPAVCRAILELLRKAPTPENFDRAIKACLLKPGAIDMTELPLNLLPMSLDEAKVPDWLPPWFWSTRALLAYRQADSQLAVKNVNQSEGFAPSDPCHAVSLAVLAMAQHDLKQPEEAQTTLNEGQQLLTKLQANNRHHHDTLIAEILYREAEAKINGPIKPKPPNVSTIPQP